MIKYLCFSPDDPSVELSVLSRSDTSGSDRTLNLFCSGTGFNPNIRWLSKKHTDVGTKQMIQEGGRVKVSSEISVSLEEWNQGVTFTCQVSDQSKSIQKTINICAGILHVRKVYDFYRNPDTRVCSFLD